MKRFPIFVLCILLLCVGCRRLPNVGESGDGAVSPTTDAPTVQNTDAPTGTGPVKSLFIANFDAYSNMKDGQTQATMFYYDLDGDGAEEEIRASIDWENDTLTVTDGSRSIVIENGAMLDHVFLCDLDPASPWRNLIVCTDWASDDYVTTVLHPEGNALVADKTVEGWVSWDDAAFCVEERTGLFGTNFGNRAYYGDAFETDSEWLDCYVPTADYIRENRQGLFENGVLLHLVRDLPCTVDGQPAVITKGNCILLVRFHESFTQAEICTEDGGVHAMIDIDFNYDEWSYSINGLEQDEYIDNIMYAD